MRYVLASIAGYVLSVTTIGFLNLYLGVQEVGAYALVYLLIYSVDFLVTAKWVFGVSSDNQRLRRYVAFLAGFWIVGIFTFTLLFSLIPNLPSAVILNSCLLFPFRFTVSKIWVYQSRS